MSRKETLNALFRVTPAPEAKGGDGPPDLALGAPNPPSPAAPPLERMRAGAVGAFAGSLRDMADEARSLREQIAAGEQVISLDPTLIDPAPVADRLAGAGDGALDALKDSMRDVGQQVPVLVRPHPSKPGRWQAAYGHRRIRAARELGLPVRALVRPLDDDALAIAQGQENIARRDLSFIEKAFFAQGLESVGLPRAAILKALATDKGDLSRYIAVANAVPIALAQRIGPAPKAGRARWLALAKALADAGWRPDSRRYPTRIDALLEKSSFETADSDGRFALVLRTLAAGGREPDAAMPHVAAPGVVLANEAGAPVARLQGEGEGAELRISERAAPGFARFVTEELPDLYRRWREARASAETGKD